MEVDVILTVLLEGSVSKFDSLDDLVTVGLKGKSVVEGVVKISEIGDFEKGKGDRVGREVPGEESWMCHQCAALGRGLMEDDDSGLERRDGQTVTVTGTLRGVEEDLHGGGGHSEGDSDETEIVVVEEDDDESHEVGVGVGEVGVVPLDGV